MIEGDYRNLNPEIARKLAEKELRDELGTTGIRGRPNWSPEDLQARTAEIVQKNRARFRRELESRFMEALETGEVATHDPDMPPTRQAPAPQEGAPGEQGGYVPTVEDMQLLSLADRSRSQQQEAALPAPGTNIGTRPFVEGNEGQPGVALGERLRNVRGSARGAVDDLADDGSAARGLRTRSADPGYGLGLGAVRNVFVGEVKNAPEEVSSFAQSWQAGEAPDLATTSATLAWASANPDRVTPEFAAAILAQARRYDLLD